MALSKEIEERDYDLLKFMMQNYGTYHNHKELMAYSIFALEGGFFLGLFLLGTWPAAVAQMEHYQLASIFVVTWALFHTALRFQLRNRRLSAIYYAAYHDALTMTEDVTYKDRWLLEKTATRLDELVDIFLFPVRTSFRRGDVKPNDLDDGSLIRPQTLSAFQYHALEHKRRSMTGWQYALTIEWITSVGSVLMLGVALLRVYSVAP